MPDGDGTFAADAADSPTSRALQEAFFADIASRYPGWTPANNPPAAASDLAPPGGAWLVAWLDGRAVGCGGVKRIDERTGEIRRVYVAGEARGRGAGRRLLAALEDEARRLGYVRVRLDTGDNQPEALALFRGAGYRHIDDYNDNPAASYWMEKDL